ncbi:MAG: DNA alkylation repair protein [Bacteroidaceae bacterium]|nr:DNA alkylation repair protein [Bacteroidaceae bacterium]
MNDEELAREIKKELRASMNGILSARMREAGMPFRLIFGVELPRLQSIANEFPQDANLANHLWKQSIRETRLLAIMLMPPEAFTLEVANEWADTLLTAEEAQVMAMILLPKTRQAKEISMAWLNEGKPLQSVCACLCLRHLLVQGIKLSAEETHNIEERLAKILPEAKLHLRKAIQALKDTLKT